VSLGSATATGDFRRAPGGSCHKASPRGSPGSYQPLGAREFSRLWGYMWD
jgi:hypothetical protein